MPFCCLCRVGSSISGLSAQAQYGATTVTGFKPGIKDWANQDSFLVRENSENLKSQRHVYAVFDGHGHLGHKVSAFCREKLLEIIESSGDCNGSTFDVLHRALIESSIDVETSGTTGTIVILNQGILEVSFTLTFDVACRHSE